MVSKTIFKQFISLGEQDRVNSESSAGMGKEAFILKRIIDKGNVVCLWHVLVDPPLVELGIS
jgi:hypothetical protein